MAGDAYASVFPGNVIPKSVWSAPATYLLQCQCIPLPNAGPNTFSTGSENKIVRDDRMSFRTDSNNARWGQLSAYYFFDDYTVNNPYPAAVGGASVPGFNALTFGRAQLINLGDTKAGGASGVFRLSSAGTHGRPARIDLDADQGHIAVVGNAITEVDADLGIAPPPAAPHMTTVLSWLCSRPTRN